METALQSGLFDGNGHDPLFLAVRNNDQDDGLRKKCNALWERYRTIAEANFSNDFSTNFHAKFWEMYLGVKLLDLHSNVSHPKSGPKPEPDFLVGSEKDQVAVEATFAERGRGLDAIPDTLQGAQEDDLVPFRECVLRVTSKVKDKSESNDLLNRGKSGPVVIAINLPYPEVWICSNPPIVAQAFLGMSGLLGAKQADGTWSAHTTLQATVERLNKEDDPIAAMSFWDKTYEHISAVILASVDPRSSSYSNPGFELLHNPNSTHPLPMRWFKLGCEYWVDGNTLRCFRH